ncbi:MAG: anti-sigma factor [Steroidobacteraceae bacterium]
MNGAQLPPDDGTPGGAEPPSDDILAGEFVLGVLDAAQHRDLQTRLDTDRAFAQRVADWERRFAPWLTDIAPVEAPAQVWTRICLRLGWKDRESAPAGMWRSLAFWRGAAVLSALVAVVAIWMSFGRTPPPPPSVAGQPSGQPPAQAEPRARAVTPLEHDDGTPGWLASVDRSRGTVLIVPVPAPPDPKGRVPELWLIPAGKSPRSLGLVSIDKSRTVTVPADVRAALVTGSVLAITLEPSAGVPHAAPTGPIIAKGAIRIEGSG